MPACRLVRESLIENEGLLPLLEVVLAELRAVGVGDVQLWFVQLPAFCFDYILAFVGGSRNLMTATAKLPRSSRTATAFFMKIMLGKCLRRKMQGMAADIPFK